MRKHSNKGTITLEACIVVPVFIMLMLLVCGLFVMFMGQQIVTHAVTQSAKSLAFDPYAVERGAASGEEELAEMFGDILSSKGGYVSNTKWYSSDSGSLNDVVSDRVKAYLLQNGGNGRNDGKVSAKLKTFGVRGGVNGLNFSDSKVENGVLTLKVSYKQEFPMDAFGLMGFNRSVAVKVRLFTWKELANSVYEVSFNSNGGSLVTNKVTNESNDKLPVPKKDGYAFLGWSTDPNAKVPNVTDLEAAKKIGEDSDGNETLYAVWMPTRTQTSFVPPNKATGASNERVRNDQVLKRGQSYTDTVYTGLSPEVLKQSGLTTVKVTIVFDGRRTNLICFNHAKVQVSSGGKTLDSHTYDHVFNKSWEEDMKLTFEFPVSDLAADGSIKIKWSTESNGGSRSDGWELGTTSITVDAH